MKSCQERYQPMHDLSNWRVIIVDDESDNIGVVKLVLEFHNAQVFTAESGYQCIELLEDVSPSLFLIDIQMPGMSGFELLDNIRKNTAKPHVPVIAVTAYSMDRDIERILEAGFDGYLGKPINAMTLVEDVQQIVAETLNKKRPGNHYS